MHRGTPRSQTPRSVVAAKYRGVLFNSMQGRDSPPTSFTTFYMHLRLFASRPNHQDTQPAFAPRRARKVHKSSIGNPIILSLPRRFEIYAGDQTSLTTLNRSGSLGAASAHTPTSQSHPVARDKESPYPLIRSYSLPSPSTLDDNPVELSPPPAARAISHSPLHVDTRRPLYPIQEQSYASPIPDSEISTLELSSPLAAQRPDMPAEPPSLPPLSFAPYFPGPHPSQDSVGPPRRPPKAYTMPVRSSVHSAAPSSTGSLHAESFVTAKSVHFAPDSVEDYPEIEDLPEDVEAAPQKTPTRSATSSIMNNIPCVGPISTQPLDRHGTFASTCTTNSATTSGGSLRRKRRRLDFVTPAFCMFWLGFVFPPCWWVGGWYFTLFCEKPASRSMFDHYVRSTRWWAMLTCGFCVPNSTTNPTTAPTRRVRSRPKTLLLPRWVRNPTQLPQLDGIAYYYPFVSRPRGYITTNPTPVPFGFLHRYFDDVTHSKLEAVKIARETPRRIIDPWIGRCRRALCYWVVLAVVVALAMMGWSFAVGSGKAKY